MVLLLGMVVVAFALRLYQIDSLSNRFHAIRQYNTAMMARGYYVQLNPAIPEWQREIALATQPPLLEPPIIQGVAVLGYLLVGQESLWIPRAFAALWWCLAAFPLFMLAKRLLRPEAAWVTTALYLFLPFGIVGSRTFQINPVMVALIIFSLDALVKYFETPSRRNWIIATLWAALANFALIYAAAVIYPIVLLWMWRERKPLFMPAILLFGFFSLLPSAIYYLNGFFGAGFLRAQGGTLFNPSLLLTVGFWASWVNKVVFVLGPVLLILILQALLTIRSLRAAWFIYGLWLSYLLFGLVFAWPISSHDYYSLPLVPIAALTIGATIQVLLAFPAIRRSTRLTQALPLVCIGIILVHGLLVYLPTTVETPEERAAFESASIIGQRLNHTREAIALTEDYGSLLTLYGYLPTSTWPNRWDRNLMGVRGETPPDVATLMQERAIAETYRHFIVTSWLELELQPDLADYLEANFTVLERTDSYVIYNLQSRP
jgi:4-amino-4-deoxy-L-arabinose transferase-like glycosyltransferase